MKTFGASCRLTDLHFPLSPTVVNHSSANILSFLLIETRDAMKIGQNGAWDVNSVPEYGIRVTHFHKILTVFWTSG